jgi:hypothetical protein
MFSLFPCPKILFAKEAVPCKGCQCWPLLYLLHTADLSTTPESTITMSTDDTALLATDSDWAIPLQKLQTNLAAIQNWSKKWRIQANKSKSVHVTFTIQRETWLPVQINNVQLPKEDVEYLELHLDRRLTWHKHIFTKQKQLGITFTKMYWLLRYMSKLSTSNKILIYKTILKSIWAYRIQLWGTASNSNKEILECFQSKAFRKILDAP